MALNKSNLQIIVLILAIFLALLILEVNLPKESVATGAFVLNFANSDVIRSFSPTSVNPGSNVYVTLTFTLDENTSIYGMEETFPSAFTLVDAGTGTSDINIIRWFDYNANPGTINLTYTLTAPSLEGTYIFDGDYLFEEDETLSSIGGITSLQVVAGSPPTPPNPPSGGGGGGGGGGTPPTNSTDTNTPDTNDSQNDPKITPAKCGDLECNGSETCKSCWIDCGKCFEPENIQKIVEGDVKGTILDMDTIGDYGRDYTSYIYAFGALASFMLLMAMFRLFRIRRGEPPSTIDWKKISIGIKNI